MKKLLFYLILITTIFFTGCNPMEIIKLERGGLSFTLPDKTKNLPTQDDVVLYRIIVSSFEHGFEAEKEGIPGQTITFDNLLPGNYDVLVLALNDNNIVIFQGHAENILVIPGVIKQVIVQLGYATGGIEISIIFPEGTTTPEPTSTPTTEPTTVPTIEPTPVITPTPVLTPTPDTQTAGSLWFIPTAQTVSSGSEFTTGIHLNSGNQYFAAYGIDIIFNPSIIDINTDAPDSVYGVIAGNDGFITVANTMEAGIIKTAGFDAVGKGPGADLHILTIYWDAFDVGYTELELLINDLSDEYVNSIPNTPPYNPTTFNGSVTVE